MLHRWMYAEIALKVGASCAENPLSARWTMRPAGRLGLPSAVWYHAVSDERRKLVMFAAET